MIAIASRAAQRSLAAVFLLVTACADRAPPTAAAPLAHEDTPKNGASSTSDLEPGRRDADARTASRVPALGAVFAPRRLVGERLRVRWMYREAPTRNDSGWRFFSGEETQEFIDDPKNLAIYDVTTIAAIDPDIVPLLETPAPCAFERARASDAFKRVPPPVEPP